MAPLARFDAPARLDDLDSGGRAAWDEKVRAIFADFLDGEQPQFYDPTAKDMPFDAAVAPVTWPAFPAQVALASTSEEGRWRHADEHRDEQDEYCEWSVERDDDERIVRVTFTTEVPEYWKLIADRDPDRLLALYRELVDPDVALEELFVDGSYNPGNARNDSTTGRVVHLVQRTNTLRAAVDLVARATVLRKRADDTPVTNQQELVICSALGEPLRQSDPQIARAVNNAAAGGADITLRDPVGLYLDDIDTTSMQTPDDTDPSAFWTIERGDDGHAVRARFDVPSDRDYTLADVKLNDRPINFGGQLADQVRIRATVLVVPGTHRPQREPCLVRSPG